MLNLDGVLSRKRNVIKNFRAIRNAKQIVAFLVKSLSINFKIMSNNSYPGLQKNKATSMKIYEIFKTFINALRDNKRL